MQITLGFALILILIIFPGLIFRKLYFFDEFSNQFRAGLNLISLLTVAAVPGSLCLLIVFILFHTSITEIDLGIFIDGFKDLGDPNFRYSKTEGKPILTLLNEGITPFIVLQYFVALLLGFSSGRIVRLTKLDTKIKLLRFKNFWFYLFTGNHADFKKMNFLSSKDKKHVLTHADILINTDSETHLYSGFVVDYKLKPDTNNTLDKVILEKARRYKQEADGVVARPIKGHLFIVDCEALKNINLSYVYEEKSTYYKSDKPKKVIDIIAITSIVLIPFFFFKSDLINNKYYDYYFTIPAIVKVFTYIFAVSFVGACIPFYKDKENYKRLTLKIWLTKVFPTPFTLFIFLMVYFLFMTK